MKPLDFIKEEKIIQAVFAIAGKLGLAGISIAAISKEAGISVGSLYTYFKSKEEIIQVAFSSVEHKMTQHIYKRLNIDDPLKKSIKRIYMNMLKYRFRYYNETVFIDQYIQSNYIQLNFLKQRQEFEQQNKPLYNLLKKGQDEGVIVKMDIFMIISFINSAVRSSSNNILQKFIPHKKLIIEEGFDMVWKGITN